MHPGVEVVHLYIRQGIRVDAQVVQTALVVVVILLEIKGTNAIWSAVGTANPIPVPGVGTWFPRVTTDVKHDVVVIPRPLLRIGITQVILCIFRFIVLAENESRAGIVGNEP